MMLYDYQQEMLDRVEKALGIHRSVMVQMPTGTGKTLVMASLVEHAANEGGNAVGCRVLVVAHRMELISQIADILGRFGINCGIIAQGRELRGECCGCINTDSCPQGSGRLWSETRFGDCR